jgi:phosphomannomutase
MKASALTKSDSQSDAIRFGTDGWRAIIGEGFTFANLEKVAQAYADYINSAEPHNSNRLFEQTILADQKHPLIVIGYDRRFLSEQFAERTAEIMAGNDLNVALFDKAVPTPLISWVVRENNAAGGIVITASHNPPEFNGFKIKDFWGGSASSKTTAAVESFIDSNTPRRADIHDFDKSETLSGAIKSYRTRISELVDLEFIRTAHKRVIIDSMHGSGGRWTESFLLNGDLQIQTIRAERDPLFGGVNPEPIKRNLRALKNCVLETKAVLGLATDGDCDRLGAVNELGQTMTMHEVVPLLLLHLARKRHMTGGVVRTFSQSVLIKRIAAAYQLPLYETPVGFKYIADLMLSDNILIGAEESGGIGIHGHIPERDGILTSLLLLEAVIAGGKPPSELIKDIHREFGEFYFERRDLKMEVGRGQSLVAGLAANPPGAVAGEKVVAVETLDGTKLLFADESWLLFRQSGTEPVLRVYCEATSIVKMRKLIDAAKW